MKASQIIQLSDWVKEYGTRLVGHSVGENAAKAASALKFDVSNNALKEVMQEHGFETSVKKANEQRVERLEHGYELLFILAVELGERDEAELTAWLGRMYANEQAGKVAKS